MKKKAYKNLKDYGVIGNLDTCAIINNEGVIEWYCFPHLESPSVFASILDTNKGGYFSLQPALSFSSTQTYIKNTNVLQTNFLTPLGTGYLADFMPVKNVEKKETDHQAIFRKIVCQSGILKLRIEFAPRFNYARSKTKLTHIQNGIEASGNKPTDHIFLHAPFKFAITKNTAVGEYSVKQGESLWLVLRHSSHHHEKPSECEKVLNRTLNYWRQWSHTCREPKECIFNGPLHDVAVRSGLILKLLMNHDEGSIAAAATTSIPEDIGGVRNWDYRFNWVRDASFAIQAFYHLGHVEEAKNHLKWFTQVCKQHRDPADIQPLYGMYGRTKIPEEELYGLEGYRGSRPVRIGNRAYGQKQLDVYGELINAFYETTRYGKSLTKNDWAFVEKIVNHVCKIWSTEDAGIWEMRSEPKHFVYSKVMCWVALDRGIRIAESKEIELPLKRWKEIRKEIEVAVLEKGFSKKLNSFVQSFDSEELDASTLLIPIMGFLPFDDSRVEGTIKAILKHLTINGKLVFRYKAEDGVHGKEGIFLLCSFWLVKALALSGRIKEAENVLNSILRFVSPTGLLSEEVDPNSGELLGNFPQAFSHIGLINSILYLNKAKGRKHEGPAPLGVTEKGKQ